jgi:protein-disulfide isomerase
MSTTSPPTKRERRDAARAARLERERAVAAAAARRRRLPRLGAVLGAAAVIVVVAVAVSSGAGTKPSTSAPAHAADVRSMLAGIPQRGATLGDPKAPVRVVEFADLQCPFCANYSRTLLPRLVRDYVRPGKVRMELRTLAFIGPDSVRAARVAQAAGRQNKMWNVADLVYLNQRRENSGYLNDAFLRRIARAVPGLDVSRVFAQRGSAAVTRRLQSAQTEATRAGVDSTPTFLVGRGAHLTAVDANGLRAAIAAAVKG